MIISCSSEFYLPYAEQQRCTKLVTFSVFVNNDIVHLRLYLRPPKDKQCFLFVMP